MHPQALSAMARGEKEEVAEWRTQDNFSSFFRQWHPEHPEARGGSCSANSLSVDATLTHGQAGHCSWDSSLQLLSSFPISPPPILWGSEFRAGNFGLAETKPLANSKSSSFSSSSSDRDRQRKEMWGCGGGRECQFQSHPVANTVYTKHWANSVNASKC